MKRYLGIIFLLIIVFQVKAQVNNLAEKIQTLTPNTSWQQKKTVPIQFPTFHPQGMVKIGDAFYMSSVEIIKTPKNGDAGEGIGHLLKFDSTGTLLAQMTLGEGNIYHPGSIDYDGKDIWIPVAEYRPNSKSIIYKVNPKSMKAMKVMRFDEHIGAIVYNTDSNSLMGMNWGSRNFYEWKLNPI